MSFSSIDCIDSAIMQIETNNPQIHMHILKRELNAYNSFYATYEFRNLLNEIRSDIRDRIRIMRNITLANEADREDICRVILCRILTFVNKKYHLSFKIGNKHNLARGFYDLGIFIEDERGEQIKMLIEVKKSNLKKARGQLLLELYEVFKHTEKKIFGFITNAEIWQMYSLYKQNDEIIIEEFEPISFKSNLLNPASIQKLTYAMLFAIQHTENIEDRNALLL